MLGQGGAVLEVFMMWIIVCLVECIHERKIISISFLLDCWRGYQCFPQHLNPFSLQDCALMGFLFVVVPLLCHREKMNK